MDKLVDTGLIIGVWPNPYKFIEYNAQSIKKFIVWSGIWNGEIITHFFIKSNLNEEKYRNLLVECVWPIIFQLINTNRKESIFMQDGNPVHNSNFAKVWLDEHFPGR